MRRMRKGSEGGRKRTRNNERAKWSAARLGRAVFWRRGCNVSSAPNDVNKRRVTVLDVGVDEDGGGGRKEGRKEGSLLGGGSKESLER